MSLCRQDCTAGFRPGAAVGSSAGGRALEGLRSRLGACSICMDQVSKRLQTGGASMHGQTMRRSTATLGSLPPERR
jgi:hypothetical protein